MDDNRKTKIWALAATLVISLLVLLLLATSHLTFDPSAMAPSEREAEVTFDNEFVDLLEPARALAQQSVDDAPAAAQANEQKQSQPTPASGTDLDDAGEVGDAVPPVQSQQESPMQVKKRQEEERRAAAAREKERQEAEMKRQANNEVTDAFKRSNGKHNDQRGQEDQGNSGTPQGTSPSGALRGTGQGTAGGGWAIPAYAAVPSTVTGSIKMTVTIDRTGKVTALSFTGGDAPAATNSALRAACEAEVRSRRFTRSNPDDAPESSKAYITYTFR